MLEFIDVSVNVGRSPILSHISTTFEEGQITTIIGPNGCGKTSLLQTLNGQSKLTVGKIMLDGEDFLEKAIRERAKSLSFMPQFRETVPCISVKGLVEHGRFPYLGFSRTMSAEDRQKVEDALDFVSMTDSKSKIVSELSGGQQQRAYLAMQLAQDCPYLVLDEPMNHLDFEGQRNMLSLIRSLKKANKTIILVLHDINQALMISDSLVIMKNRELIAKTSPKSAIESGLIEDVFNCKIRPVDVDGETQYLLT